MERSLELLIRVQVAQDAYKDLDTDAPRISDRLVTCKAITDTGAQLDGMDRGGSYFKKNEKLRWGPAQTVL